MCGIVGAVAERNVVAILLEGLKRLEYRGYDSAGLALLQENQELCRLRRSGKVRELEQYVTQNSEQWNGTCGIAHTRWATHGIPSETNAHPHVNNRQDLALVHNGIIENYTILQQSLIGQGIQLASETDSEVIVHWIAQLMDAGQDILTATRETLKTLKGAYAIGLLSNKEQRIIAARSGSPLVIGIGIGEHFIASDVTALLPVTRKFIFLEEGDIADIRRDSLQIYDSNGKEVEREIKHSALDLDVIDKGNYRHYMQKEIFEQPRAITETLEGRINNDQIFVPAFGYSAEEIFAKTEAIYIVACGTSYHAGMVAKYWFESIVGISCQVEVASEFRYRQVVLQKNTLLVLLSQSGETADTLAALRIAKQWGVSHSLAICNVPESSLVREAELVFMTHAGPEIGVASTKAFTTQLVAMLLLVIALRKQKGLPETEESHYVNLLRELPCKIEQILTLDKDIEILSQDFADKQHSLFLGRGSQYPIAMEGALKLKEISYIHAEAYPAGELKHGPIALIDADMPVVVVAPNNALVDKLKANLQEIRARGGELIIFTDHHVAMEEKTGCKVLIIKDSIDDLTAPIVFTVALQLLAYHVAVIKGTDIDQPRNLAKSVTVE